MFICSVYSLTLFSCSLFIMKLITYQAQVRARALFVPFPYPFLSYLYSNIIGFHRSTLLDYSTKSNYHASDIGHTPWRLHRLCFPRERLFHHHDFDLTFVDLGFPVAQLFTLLILALALTLSRATTTSSFVSRVAHFLLIPHRQVKVGS